VARSFTAILSSCVFVATIACLAEASESLRASTSLTIAELPVGVSAPTQAVISGTLDRDFVALPGGELATSTTATRWFRISLNSDWVGHEPPVLSIADAGYTRFRLHAPPDYRERPLWHEMPNESARFSRHALTVTLPAGIRSDQPVYLAADPVLTTTRPRVALTELARYQASDLNHVRIVTAFASIQFVMVLVGLCLWLALRDRVLIYFVAYAGLQLVYQLLVSGEIYDVPGGSALAPFGQRAAWFFATASAAISIAFIIEFCNLRRNSPRLAAILGAFRWPYGVAAIFLLLPWPGLAPLLQNLLNLLFLLSSLLALATVARVAGYGNRASRFFLVAWMPQVAFTIFRVTQILLLLPHPAWIEYGYPFTMAFSSIVIVIGLADSTLHARRERDIAHGLAEHDGLTGVLNRRALDSRLAELADRVRTDGGRLALLFIDIDHFKSINDRHGHLAGDACLKAVASAVASSLKDGQHFGRYGGEEFLAILPETNKDEAAAIGERLRRLVEGLVINAEGIELTLTASIGVSCLGNDSSTVEQLVDRADQALYRAKAEGRNRVGIHPLSSSNA